MCQWKGKEVEKDADIGAMRERIVSYCSREAITAHFLVGMIPFGLACATSSYRYYMRGEGTMAALALIAGYSKGVGVLAIAQVAFSVRLSQVMTEFEIRRTECDIRTVVGSLETACSPFASANTTTHTHTEPDHDPPHHASLQVSAS